MENPEKNLSVTCRQYQLPITNVVLQEEHLWGPPENRPIMLRPKDLDQYGLPEASVNDLIYKATETIDPIPFLKLGRKTLIPRCAFELWLLRQAHVREVITPTA